MPFKLLEARFSCETSPLKPQTTPVHATDPDPQGYVVATLPLQFHPVTGMMVGIMVGFDAVGARVKGADVGEGVGFDGQLVIPSLNTHRALASDC